MNVKMFLVAASFVLLQPLAVADTIDESLLFGSWCLVEKSQTQNGPRTTHASNYGFSQSGEIQYQSAFFKQSDQFEVIDGSIRTDKMGSYDIVNINSRNMILVSDSFMYFDRGECRR